MIASGEDMWEDACNETLKGFRNNYIFKFSALPTKTQFTELGVKESGFVSLGRRGRRIGPFWLLLLGDIYRMH